MSTPTQKVSLKEIEVQLALGSVSVDDLPLLVAQLDTTEDVEEFVKYLLSHARRKGISLKITELIRILRAALKNPNAKAPAFISAASHKSTRIRSAVAIHPWTPPEILAYLANDSKEAVKAAVAENIKAPVEILEKLYDPSDNSTYSCRALRNANASAQMQTDAINIGTMRHLQIIASNHTRIFRMSGVIDVMIDRVMAGISADTSVGGAINALSTIIWSSQRHTVPISADTVRKHAYHPNSSVREAFALSPSTPIDVLLSYLRDPVIKVRCKAISTGRIPTTQLKLRFLAENSEKVKKAIEHQLAKELKK